MLRVQHEPLAHDVRECRIIVPSLNILALNFNPMDVCIIDTWHASTDVVHCSLSLSLFNYSHLASRALIAAILSASALLRCGSGKEKKNTRIIMKRQRKRRIM